MKTHTVDINIRSVMNGFIVTDTADPSGQVPDEYVAETTDDINEVVCTIVAKSTANLKRPRPAKTRD